MIHCSIELEHLHHGACMMLSFIHYRCHLRQLLDVLQLPVLLIFDILLLVNSVKAAESVSFRKYCMWILPFYKKLHITKLSMRAELIPLDKPFYDF